MRTRVKSGALRGEGGCVLVPGGVNREKIGQKNFKNGRKRKKNIGNFSYDLKWSKLH